MATPLRSRPMNILIAVDGSEHALAGVSTVRDLPLPAGSRVVILAVFIPRNASYYTEYEHSVQVAAQELTNQPWQVKTEVAAGHPAETISRVADEIEADLIVLGARGLRSALGVLLGGVAQQVVEYANRPVMVVRAPYQGLNRIVLATDGSPCSDLALRYLASFPLPLAIRDIDLLHVLPPPPLPQAVVIAQTIPVGIERAAMLEVQDSAQVEAMLKQEEVDGQVLLEEVKKRFIHLLPEFPAQPKVEQILLRGDAYEEIKIHLHQNPADLLVVGSRGLSGVRGWLLGSLSRKLVHGADCSVLVVRGVPNC